MSVGIFSMLFKNCSSKPVLNITSNFARVLQNMEVKASNFIIMGFVNPLLKPWVIPFTTGMSGSVHYNKRNVQIQTSRFI